MDREQLAVGIFRYTFPPDLAKKIVKKLNKLDSSIWMPSLVGGGHSGNIKTYIRSSESVDLFSVDSELGALTKQFFIECIKDYSRYFDVEVRSDEGFGILKYENDDKYEYHTDSGWNSYRVISGLIYLNPTEYSGGETHFKHFNVGVKPDVPSVVLFPSDYAYLHAAMPVTSGKKYILVTWLNDRPSDIVIHERSDKCQ